MVVIGTPVGQNPTDPVDAPPVPQPGRGGSWFVTAAPTARPVTIAEARRQCRLEDSDDSGVTDADLCVYIDAAVEYVETRLEAALMPRTVAETFYDGRTINLSRGPVISVLGMTDRNNASVTDYTSRTIGNTTRVQAKAGLMYPVTVTYRAGYAMPNGTVAAIPADLKLAILQLTATYYENRESISEKTMVPIPHTVESFFVRKGRGLGVG